MTCFLILAVLTRHVFIIALKARRPVCNYLLPEQRRNGPCPNGSTGEGIDHGRVRQLQWSTWYRGNNNLAWARAWSLWSRKRSNVNCNNQFRCAPLCPQSGMCEPTWRKRNKVPGGIHVQACWVHNTKEMYSKAPSEIWRILCLGVDLSRLRVGSSPLSQYN